MPFLDLTFWSLWSLTAITAGFQVIRPLVTGHGLLGFPFVAGLAWLYFYVYMAFDVAVSLRDFVPVEALCLGQFVALISFLGLVGGWGVAVRRWSRVRVLCDHNRYPAEKLWKAGLLFLVAGCIGQYTFMGQENIDWQHSTAYWYMLFYLGYPGAALCIASILRTRPQQRRSRYITLSIALGALLIPFVLGARRGPLFPGAIVIAFAPVLFTGKLPRRLVIFSALAGSGALMLLFVAIRPYIYTVEGHDKISSAGEVSTAWRGGLSDLSTSKVLLGKGARLGDNEYAFHCATVWTLFDTGRYQYGTGYLTLLIHWIPRQLWPDKPGLGQGLFPSVGGEIPTEMGWERTAGSSWGGVADVFEEFGFLSPLFWAALAYLAGRSYQAALSHQLSKEIAYLGFMSGTHWLISQGFSPAVVPLCIFIIPPLVILRFARAKSVQRPSRLHHITVVGPRPISSRIASASQSSPVTVRSV